MSTTLASSHLAPSPLLRSALLIDAVASGGIGLLLIAGATPLSGFLGLPQPLLLGAGIVCCGWAAVTGWLSRRAALQPGIIWLVIALNAVWVIESALLLLSGWVSPTATGHAFVIALGLLVAGFAEAQYLGLKRSGARESFTA